jgi:hypothetical protein
MALATQLGKKHALAELAKRRKNQPKQIRNSSLPAGYPMYFYCQTCGHIADTKPESYIFAPKSLCDECQALKDLGWLE